MKKLFSVLFAMTIFIFISVAVTDNAFSQSMIQKIGKRCPFGYTSDGSYCRPLAGCQRSDCQDRETMSFRIYF